MPDFSDSSLFPTFRELPPAAGDDATGNADAGGWSLLAQIKENMTITKPTLIATDRSGVDFAIIFDEPGFSLKGFRKGYTLLVPAARRTDREELGKKAVVRVEAGRCGGVRVSKPELGCHTRHVKTYCLSIFPSCQHHQTKLLC